jgi:hypothetical protein
VVPIELPGSSETLDIRGESVAHTTLSSSFQSAIYNGGVLSPDAICYRIATRQSNFREGT